MSRTLTALAAAVLLGLAAMLLGSPAGQSAPDACPYSGGGPAYLFQSWEAQRDRALYFDAQRLAASNLLFPDDEEFALQPLKVGIGGERREDPFATIPAPLLYAIGWVESSTNQTAPDVPYESIGPALVSFDCGYGIMQVTSTISNEGALPSRYEALVGTHFAYNIAAGAQILAEKWNDEFFPQVGTGDPSVIESWYYALWGYNGWALSNHPAGPDVDPFRAPQYGCDGRRNGYPYQELVLGCVVNPPELEGRPLWDAIPLALPDLDLMASPGWPLDPEHYYAGWNEIRNLGGPAEGAASPFAAMYMPLPQSAAPYPKWPLSEPEVQQLRERVLGAPRLRLDDAELELSSSGGAVSAASLLIENEGSGLLAWRVAGAPSWVQLEVQAGVAVGGGAAFADAEHSTLIVRAAAGGVPEGEHIGELRLEASLPDGSTASRTVTVSLNKLGAAFYRAGQPQS